jgi:hypothetical protein
MTDRLLQVAWRFSRNRVSGKPGAVHGSPEQLVMGYLQSHDEITNAIGRELTGIKSENTMKEVFYRLRDREVLEQVPEKLGNKAAWRKTTKKKRSRK